MRTRKNMVTILEEELNHATSSNERQTNFILGVVLEVLLDIRDLLKDAGLKA